MQHASDKSHPNYERIHQFLEDLAICHTVFAHERRSNGHIAYNASSPDEWLS